MGEAYITRRGGGDPLNFKVVGGTSAPSSPKENTIWVNTDQEITFYAFQPYLPYSPAEGWVWIRTGTDGATGFNALKKNRIQLHPIFAKQYVGGAWTDVTAKSYKGGKWVSWWVPGTMFENGIDDTALTGGWDSFAYSAGSGFDGKKISVEIASDGIFASFPNAKQKSTFVGTNSRVDVSSYTTLTMSFSEARRSTDSGAIKVVLYSDAGYTSAAEAAVISTSGETILEPEIDVSGLSGSYYIGFFMWAWDTCDLSAKMTSAKLR